MSMFQTLVWVAFVLLLVFGAVLFLRLIILAYRTEGYPHSDGNRGYAVRSAALWPVRLGRMGLAPALRAWRATLEILYEASADLGEWSVNRIGLDAESRFRTHPQ